VGTAAVDEGAGLLYVGTGNGSVFALRLADAGVAWRSQLSGTPAASPTFASDSSFGSVLLVSADAQLVCLEAATGFTRWAFSTGAPLVNSSAAVDVATGSAILTGRDTSLYSLDVISGGVRYAIAAFLYDIIESAYCNG
jgi:outer membrane protein assembly factor BamB